MLYINLLSGVSLHAMNEGDNPPNKPLHPNDFISSILPLYIDGEKFKDACEKGELHQIKAMLRGSFDDKEVALSAFKEACAKGRTAVVKALLADQRFREFKSYVMMLRFAVEDAVEIVGENFKEIAFALTRAI
jgi:hypothetical protein